MIATTESTAFGALYDRYYPAVYRYAYHRIGNRLDAEDIASQTFYLAWTHFERYQWEKAPFSAWLYRIAANLIVDQLRRRKPTASLDEALEVADRGPNPDEVVEKTERIQHLTEAVRSLSLYQKRAILLRFGKDFTNAEVAAQMGRTETAVKQLVHRGVAALRKTVASDETLCPTPSVN